MVVISTTNTRSPRSGLLVPAGGVPQEHAVRSADALQHAARLVVGEVREDLGHSEVVLGGPQPAAEELLGELRRGPLGGLDQLTDLVEPPFLAPGDRLGAPRAVAERRPVAGE